MSEWRIFNPKKESFQSEKKYNEYRKHCMCAVCHKQLEINDEFDLRSIQTLEQVEGLTCQAVLVHKKCVDDGNDGE